MPFGDPAGYLPNVKKKRAKSGLKSAYKPRSKQGELRTGIGEGDGKSTPRKLFNAGFNAEKQNNTRGMGLARDVKAGQAKPLPKKYVKSIKRRTGN